MSYLVVLVVLIAVVILYVLGTYNLFVTAKVRVQQSFRDIDIQLKKRYDLLPDLVETAKKATSLDEKIFTQVTRLRSDAIEAKEAGAPLSQRADVENKLSGMMRDIKVAVEAYPDIKSHGELLDLMSKVSDIEEKIAYSRQFYNSNVADYNTKIKLFPAMIIASNMGFKGEEFFAAPEEEKKDIKVSF